MSILRIFKKEHRGAQRFHRVAQRTLWVALCLLCAALCSNISLQAQPAADIVSAEGQVVPTEQIALAFQIGGTVETVFVAEGDMVQAGAPLLQLNPAAAELGLQQAQARLATAQSGLLAAQNEQDLAETAVATAQSRLQVAQANLALVKSWPTARANRRSRKPCRCGSGGGYPSNRPSGCRAGHCRCVRHFGGGSGRSGGPGPGTAARAGVPGYPRQLLRHA